MICTARVAYNGTTIAMLKPEPMSDELREHITLELLRSRIEFEIGSIYQVTIERVE